MTHRIVENLNRTVTAVFKYMNGGYSLPVLSGTSVSYVALQSLNLNYGDEI